MTLFCKFACRMIYLKRTEVFKMKKKIITIIALSLTAILSACSDNSESPLKLSLHESNNSIPNQSSNNESSLEFEIPTQSGQKFTSLNLEISKGTIFIRSGNSFSLTRSDGSMVDYDINNNTLYFQNSRVNEIVLTLPENETYNSLIIAVSDGHVYGESSLTVQSFNLQVEQGEAAFKQIIVSSNSIIDVRDASAYLYGDFGHMAITSCQNGHLNMQVPFEKTDCNYNINISGGSVQLENDSYHGKEYATSIDNDSDCTFMLTCINGDTSIDFEKASLTYDYNKTNKTK